MICTLGVPEPWRAGFGQALVAMLVRDLRLAVPPERLLWDHGDGLVLRGLTALPVIAGRADRPVAEKI